MWWYLYDNNDGGGCEVVDNDDNVLVVDVNADDREVVDYERKIGIHDTGVFDYIKHCNN